MDYDAIRRVVEEEVVKTLSQAPSTPRLRRPVVAESMIVAARRRGAREIEVTPGAIVTPAARDRAASLGLVIRETRSVARPARDVEALVEQVMAAVTAELSGRRPAPILAPARRRLVTAREIELARFRHEEIRLGRKDRITPLARDLAERLGVRIVEER